MALQIGSRNLIFLLQYCCSKLSNNQQINYFQKKLLANLKEKNNCVMVWGLAFKGGTDDVRESFCKVNKKIANSIKKFMPMIRLQYLTQKKSFWI